VGGAGPLQGRRLRRSGKRQGLGPLRGVPDDDGGRRGAGCEHLPGEAQERVPVPHPLALPGPPSDTVSVVAEREIRTESVRLSESQSGCLCARVEWGAWAVSMDRQPHTRFQ
jgi:hypothetical protein